MPIFHQFPSGLCVLAYVPPVPVREEAHVSARTYSIWFIGVTLADLDAHPTI